MLCLQGRRCPRTLRLFLSAILIFVLHGLGMAQNQAFKVRGTVYGFQPHGKLQTLVGANIIWKSTLIGTTTDSEGNFTIERIPENDSLVISYIGYQADTILATAGDFLVIKLRQGIELSSTEIVYRQKSTQVSKLSTIKVETMGKDEIHKAACCNLSESFETNASVDVSYTDAITGTKQITMLGLAGPYSQLTKENMPDIRGLAAINGMSFIPGTWIDAIQLIHGAGSVVNGFESIAGQINTELKKSSTVERFYVNLYANNEYGGEANMHVKIPIGKKWRSAVLLHGKYNNYHHDKNADGFMDMPLNKSIIALNRYEWINDRDIHFEFGGRYIYMDQLAGQMGFNRNMVADSLNPWGALTNISKGDVWMKLGKVNHLKPWQSTAIQLNAATYNQQSKYGFRNYDGKQNSLYANLIHQGRVKSDTNQYKLGLSFVGDAYDEILVADTFKRDELVVGAFGEYSYKPGEKFSLVAGIRTDFHNHYGLIFTPRLHLRIEPLKDLVVRASIGSGFRTANVIAEHIAMLASSRSIEIEGDNSNYGFGLNPEKAWNYGLSINKSFELNYRDGLISISYFITNFEDQVVFDMETKGKVKFYNLDGESFANSFQAQLDYEVFKRFDVRLAYRFYDVKTSYEGKLKSAPLLASHRGFLNLAYGTRNNWKFDLTINRQGMKRIPDFGSGESYSPAYYIINAQVTKKWKEKFDLYAGGENLTNFVQENPIISAQNPYSQDFDASLVWGPIFGTKIYIGMRYYIL